MFFIYFNRRNWKNERKVTMGAFHLVIIKKYLKVCMGKRQKNFEGIMVISIGAK